ncbi:ErfK/YbiS/YcfS/YnhG [Limosilactobacillus coleohominis 101-4-CHN]|uniref:ErfK/YbiS/YcfS/YnhG n=1 Tax=Limosilactobacillus coleohominis 101-4-CHN TaxID=575594 RepID=C7XX54_9LACO|nr:L,D-transpeptidase [Limosilactobacillus coleohominis]EEU29874.1 ErfK/YbiS/YcfS/YnhG [Limosilactobacillus coleohominis 101-4-CHN]
MTNWKKNLIYCCFCVVVLYFGAVRPLTHQASHVAKSRTSQTANEKSPRSHHSKHHQQAAAEQSIRRPINWKKSSETKPYPDLTKVKNFNVLVKIKKNRTYLRDGKKVIYTMYSSAGNYHRDAQTGSQTSDTPTGTFYVQAERGANFFNSSLNEGANYYVSWLNHGEYLFHSVPTSADGSYNLKEAKKLGKSTGSHGCVRLSVADAQWMMEHLPVGTKVTIED